MKTIKEIMLTISAVMFMSLFLAAVNTICELNMIDKIIMYTGALSFIMHLVFRIAETIDK